MSDVAFTLDANLNIFNPNRSFSHFFNTTDSQLNLRQFLDAADGKNIAVFLQNYAAKNKNHYFTVAFKLPAQTVNCVLHVERKRGDKYAVTLQELACAQDLLEKTILRNRECTALLSKFNSYFIMFNGSKYALCSTKDMNDVYLGNKEDFVIYFIDFFNINTEIDASKYQLDTLFNDIENGIGDKKYRLLMTDNTNLLVTTMRSDARNSFAVLGLITHRNIALTDTSYSEKRDGLTELYNKQAITDLAIKKIDIAKQPVTMFIIDVDRFKEFNDNFGHAYGDKVLVAVAKVIKDSVGDQGVSGRIGGDEFLCIIDRTDEEEIRNIARNIKMGIQWSLAATELEQVVTCSIGIARTPINAETYSDAFKIADKCLYIAKMRGRNCYIIYKPEIHDNLIITQEESTRNTASGKLYMENALSEIDIMREITKKEPNYIEKSLYMLREYITVHKICVYEQTEAKNHWERRFILGKDEVDIRLKHLNAADEDYFRYYNAYDFFHLDNVNNLDTMDKDRFHMYLEDNVASTLEILCKSADGKSKVLICLDIYKPSRNFQAHKIVFAIMAAKLISHELSSTITV